MDPDERIVNVMAGNSAHLDYAPPPRRHRRRWFRRIIGGVSLVSLCAVIWWWGPEKLERAKLLYWQWQCMNYSAPENQVVYDQDPVGSSSLLKSSGYISWMQYGLAGGPITAAAMVPRCADRFIALYNASTSASGGGWNAPILFMHERTAHSGKRYLIIIRGVQRFETWHWIGQLCVNDSSFKPGNWRALPESTGGGGGYNGLLPWPPKPTHRRVFAGQPDPKDSSRFTIRYEEDGKPGFIVGFVDEFKLSGDPEPIMNVEYSERTRPSTVPADGKR